MTIIYKRDIVMHFQDTMKTTRPVKMNDIPFRTVTVKDNTDSVVVALWRDSAEADVHTGDYVEISHVVVNSYQDQLQLQTTHFSSIRVTVFIHLCIMILKYFWRMNIHRMS